MDFNLSSEQEALVSAAREFARDALLSLDGGCSKSEGVHAAWKSRWEKCAQSGYAGMPLPESTGGRGLSLVDCMLVLETMAGEGVEPGFLFSLGVHQFAAASSVAWVGSDQQKAQLLPSLATGKTVGALAVSEREAGSDSYAMSARAEERDGGFVINGEKVWISNAPIADLFLICARTDDVPGAFGISCFIVACDSEGLSVESGPSKAGLKGAPWGRVKMDGVKVSADSMLGGRGGGGAVFRSSMRWERCGLYAIALGAMEKSFQDCLSHVRNRKQFGRPLVDNDVVAKSLALMKTRMEAARLLLYKAAASVDGDEADDAAVCLAKAYVSETGIANALSAQELYGASGILEESSATTFLNDMLPFRILSGPTDVQYKIATRLLARAAR